MYDSAMVNDLAKDFRSWGFRSVLRIQRMTEKYGVLCNANLWSDGEKG